MDEDECSEAWAKAKIDSLFFQWISSQEGSDVVRQLVEDFEQGRLVPSGASSMAAAAAASSNMGSSTNSSAPPSPLDAKKSSSIQQQQQQQQQQGGGGDSTPPTPTSKKSPAKKPTPMSSSSSAPNTPLTGSKSLLEQKTSKTATAAAAAASPACPQLQLPPARGPIPPHLLLANRQEEIDELFDQQGDGEGLNVENFALVCQDVLKLPFCLVVPLFRRIRILAREWNQGSAGGGAEKNRESDARVDALQAKIKEEELTAPARLPNNPAWMSETQAELLAELEQGVITKQDFCTFWEREIAPFPSAEERMFRLIRAPHADAIVSRDFFPVLKELIDTHPGLEFLETAPEFQEKYARTVVARIFQRVNLSWSGRITLREWLKSDFPAFLDLVSREDEINSVNEYFSYEHFYVIYCKFWELDSNHDFTLSKEEFARFGNHALTRIIVDRIFAQVSKPFESGLANKMGYEDFCFFLLCEEDKTTEASLRYWFDLVDLNLDGRLSPWEVRIFYEEQLKRMGHFQPEDDMATLEDLLCQMKDSLCPGREDWHITLQEFIQEKQTSGVFLNQLFNLAKFLSYETRDPFAALKLAADGIEVPVLTDWDRFALQEYAKLSGAEEVRTGTNTSTTTAAVAATITPEIVAQLVEEMEQQQQRDDDAAAAAVAATQRATLPLFPLPDLVSELEQLAPMARFNLLTLFQ